MAVESQERASLLAPTVAALATASSGALFLMLAGIDPGSVVVASFLGLSALLCLHRHIVSQVLVRGTLWANFLLAFAGSLVADEPNQRLCTVGLLGLLSVALIALGNRGLHDEQRSGAFRPVAHRGTLIAGAIFSVAVAEATTVVGAQMALVETAGGDLLLLAGMLFAILLAMVGLFRLQLWGLLLKTTLDLGFLGLAGSLLVKHTDAPTLVLVGLAVFQSLLMLPIWISILRRRVPQNSVPVGVFQALSVLVVLGGLVASIIVNADTLF